MPPDTPGIARTLIGLFRDPVKLTMDLFKVMIPIIVTVRGKGYMFTPTKKRS